MVPGVFGKQESDKQLQLLTQAKLSVDGLIRGVKTQEKERQQLRALRDVGAVINSSLDQTEVLNTVMDTIIKLTGAERSFLMLYDDESESSRLRSPETSTKRLSVNHHLR